MNFLTGRVIGNYRVVKRLAARIVKDLRQDLR